MTNLFKWNNGEQINLMAAKRKSMKPQRINSKTLLIPTPLIKFVFHMERNGQKLTMWRETKKDAEDARAKYAVLGWVTTDVKKGTPKTLPFPTTKNQRRK